MREVGREMWTWLADGANIYICGGRKRMRRMSSVRWSIFVAQFGPFDGSGDKFCAN